jgi:hypothetical protein
MRFRVTHVQRDRSGGDRGVYAPQGGEPIGGERGQCHDGLVGDMPLQSPAVEVLDQFVDAKNEWKGREKEVIATTTNVPAGVNPNCGDPNRGDEVRLRREAHVRNLSLDPPIRSPEVGTSRSTR